MPSSCWPPQAPSWSAIPLADKMLADVTEVIETRFWEEQNGAIAEEFNADWSPISSYHGQNSNMHLTEALMAAFEATGERSYLDKAERIADLIIRRRAGENGYRVAEHFDGNWTVDKTYTSAIRCSARRAPRRATGSNGHG